MIISSSDGRFIVNVDSFEILQALTAIIDVRLSDASKVVPKAKEFVHTWERCSNDCLETVRQINLIRDSLARIPPEKSVFDPQNLDKKAPWYGNTSPVITSCSNYFVTADGHDLLAETVCVLCYSAYAHADVCVK